MPACKYCHRFVMIGRGNDFHLADGTWAHKVCPPVPGSAGGSLSSAQVNRLARSPRAMMRLMTGRPLGLDDG